MRGGEQRTADQRTSGPADRRTSGPADGGPADRRTSGPADRRTGGPDNRTIISRDFRFFRGHFNFHAGVSEKQLQNLPSK